ncbi:hypothetical protein M2130_001114 [Polynucleobacter sphagniphilus]|nr:hypothetical protein [Polynucleobacter sphagniphilus]
MAFAALVTHRLQNINMKFKSYYPYTLLTIFLAHNCYAVDSYRYMHVTIDTPWTIFLFLLGFIFAPFVLMVILVWRYSERKSTSNSEEDQSSASSEHSVRSQEVNK